MNQISQKQLEANRKNSKKGGPKTDEGKTVVSKNAIKHGILAKDLVLKKTGLIQESEEDYIAMVEDLTNLYEPVGAFEESQIEAITAALWRKRRVRRAEKGEIKRLNDELPFKHKENKRMLNELNQSIKMLAPTAYSYEEKLENISEIDQLIIEIDDAICEIGDEGGLSIRRFDRLIKVFHGDNIFCTIMNIEKGTALDDLPEHKRDVEQIQIRMLEEQKEILQRARDKVETRENNWKMNNSMANLVPDSATIDKLSRYETALDRQVKNAMEMLIMSREFRNKPP